MNIVIAIQSLEIGGAERQVVELAHGLGLLGHNVSICCLNRLGPLANEARSRGITVDCLNKTSHGDLRVIFKLAQYLSRKKADVLHTFLFGANFWGTLAGRLAGVPVKMASDRSGGRYEEKKELWADRILLAFVDGMISNTSVGKQRVHQMTGMPSKRIHVIVNSMNWDRFKQLPDQAFVRQKLGFVSDSFVVVFAGRVHWIKNPDMFMKTARILCNESKRFMFLVVGSGPNLPQMKAQAKHYALEQRILFIGQQQDVPKLLVAADAGVLCSHWEGFSNSIMEYMAAGLPVVATDVGGNRDLVQQNSTGFLVRPNDVEQMCEKLRWLAADTVMAKSLGSAGKVWVSKNCDSTYLVNKTANIYRDVLNLKGIVHYENT